MDLNSNSTKTMENSSFDNLTDIIYGKNSVYELLESQGSDNYDNWQIQKIYVDKNLVNDSRIKQILNLAKNNNIPVTQASKFKLDSMVMPSAQTLNFKANHQGVVAQTTKIKTYELDEFLDKLESADAISDSCLVVLDGIEDPRNLGAIVRSACAFNISAVILPIRRSATITASSVKASAGTMANMPLVEVTNITQSLKKLKDKGYWVTGLDLDTQDSVHNCKLQFPMVLVIGSEGKGLSRLVRQECDFLLKIPMEQKVESLNASVAAAIVMYEIFKSKIKL